MTQRPVSEQTYQFFSQLPGSAKQLCQLLHRMDFLRAQLVEDLCLSLDRRLIDCDFLRKITALFSVAHIKAAGRGIYIGLDEVDVASPIQVVLVALTPVHIILNGDDLG